MSFLRPEAVAQLRRWAEPGVAGIVALLAIWGGVKWTAQGSSSGWVALVAGALALFWTRAAVLSSLATRTISGVGLVVIREGEVGYMTPHGGGFLDLDGLSRIDIYIVPGGENPVWRLVGAEGAALAIPANAEGAEHLPEALSVLPGFSDLVAVRLLQSARNGRHVIWERR